MLIVKDKDSKAAVAIVKAVEGKVREVNTSPSQSYKDYVKTMLNAARA
ncbi:hypothetical protein [Alicyclobacillus pomorum]|nr:hypothetical protein [Alicyclobacillus pomorum]